MDNKLKNNEPGKEGNSHITGNEPPDGNQFTTDIESSYKLLLEQIIDGVFIADKEGRFIEVNSHACEMFGYTQDELLKLYITDLMPPSERITNPPRLEIIVPGKIIVSERILQCKDGSIIFAELRSRTLANGSFQAIIRDITERKRTEESLRLSEELNNRIIEAMPAGIVNITMNGSIIKANKMAQQILGLSFDELQKKYISDFETVTFREDGSICPVDEYPAARCLRENKTQENVVIGVQKPDGKISWSIFTAIPLNDIVTNEQTGAVVSFIDITNRKETEELLLKREKEIRTIMENTPDIICRYNESFQYTYINPGVVKVSNNPDTHFIGKTNRELEMPSEKADYLENIISQVFRTGKEIVDETDFDNEFGKLWYQIRWIPEFSNDGTRVVSVLSIARNISKLKETENKLKSSLNEKELLLKEVHHRVKNNLQIISSLLNLQTAYIKNDEALEMLRDSQNRIKTMAYIHEKLYQSNDLASIDFSDYLSNLTISLFHSYKVNADNIILNLDIKSVVLNIDIAIPCGMIINELVSNSLKYAFPDEKKGEIIVQLVANNQEYLLIIKDNGVGLPAGRDLENAETLGLQLVNMLIRQLQAKVIINRDNGTEFKIIISRS
jgi:PAS domain S-box-containing protein